MSRETKGAQVPGKEHKKTRYPRYNLSYHAVGLLASSEQLNEGIHFTHLSKFFMEI
jgi:hypothetical protein